MAKRPIPAGSLAEPATESELLSLLEKVLTARLPQGWAVEPDIRELTGGSRPDRIVVLSAPDGTRAHLVVEAKRSLDAAQARSASDQLDRYLRALEERGDNACGVVVAPYIRAATRKGLIERGLGYLDATGNIRLVCDEPALFVESQGADRDPWPDSSELKSLKGRSSGSAVRALVDFRPPYGIRELADRSGVSAPTLSRVVELLEREGLVERKRRGPIESLDWEGAIRRWTLDYSVTASNRVATYLDPRGLGHLSSRLRESNSRYSLTGSLALPEEVSVAPARLGMIYSSDVAGLAASLDLRQAETGVNVLLLEPFGDVVFARTAVRRGLVTVSCSQLAADLLAGPGRAPAEAEELLVWMKENENAWRSRP